MLQPFELLPELSKQYSLSNAWSLDAILHIQVFASSIITQKINVWCTFIFFLLHYKVFIWEQNHNIGNKLNKGIISVNYNPSPSRRCLPGDLAYIVEELWTLLVEWWGASPGLQVTPVEDERKGIIDQIKVTKSYIYIIILKNINREELFLINIEELFLNLFPHIHIVSDYYIIILQ